MRFTRFLPLALLVAACGSDDPAVTSDAGFDATVRPTGRAQVLTHTFPAFEVAPFEEQARNCQSWTLGNETPLFVNRVTATNEGAWHHSNWTFVRDNLFRGPDGSWLCRDREYDDVSAGLSGGVFFAQSTQAVTETQQFGPGVAFRIPSQTRVLGNVHLLNPSADPITTSMTFEVETLDEEDVHTQLLPMSYTYTALAIPPRSVSRFTMECDIGTVYEAQFARAPDFRFFYVLPHYHALANHFRLELVGGENDGMVVYETGAVVGDVLGGTIDPPIEVRGAQSLRVTCGYDNPRDEWVRYGIGDQEMCVFLAFTDAPLKFAGGSEGANEPLGEVDGIQMNRATCRTFALPD